MTWLFITGVTIFPQQPDLVCFDELRLTKVRTQKETRSRDQTQKLEFTVYWRIDEGTIVTAINEDSRSTDSAWSSDTMVNVVSVRNKMLLDNSVGNIIRHYNVVMDMGNVMETELQGCLQGRYIVSMNIGTNTPAIYCDIGKQTH